MRGTYVVVSSALMTLFLMGWAAPVPIFGLAMVMGLVRPSDITLRNLLVGETMPSEYLMRAMGVSRTTADSARIVGALTGAGLVAAVGAGVAYVAVSAVYGVSLVLTLNVGLRRVRMMGERLSPHPSPMKALRQGFAYVWSTPDMRALMLLAFLVNFAAYPLVGSLLAFVAKDVYGLDQTGLGWLIASFAGGALMGSIAISIHGPSIRPARTMLACAVGWFSLNLVFAWITSPLAGAMLLFVAGFVQSFCMIPMAVLLLRVADPSFRGRVMGVRMLAVYGMPLGLLLAGPSIESVGFAVTGTLFSAVGIACTLLIAVNWRVHLWHPAAAANVR
jgi:Na+/melibiose symporter-like transporter